jgi:hypothetical protein
MFNLLRLSAMNHPRRAELVHSHSESLRKKCFLNGHLHSATFAQSFKHAIGISRFSVVQANGHTLGLLIFTGRRISRNNLTSFELKTGVHDFFLPTFGSFFFCVELA